MSGKSGTVFTPGIGKAESSITVNYRSSHGAVIPSFGAYLEMVRIICHLSQAKLANNSGVDKSMICRLEANTRNPSRPMVTKIAKGLNLVDSGRDLLFLAAGYTTDNVTRLYMEFTVKPTVARYLDKSDSKEYPRYIDARLADDIRESTERFSDGLQYHLRS